MLYFVWKTHVIGYLHFASHCQGVVWRKLAHSETSILPVKDEVRIQGNRDTLESTARRIRFEVRSRNEYWDLEPYLLEYRRVERRP